MRSEERSGIIAIIMLFLWGTLLAEPLHIFVDYIRKFVDMLLGKFGVDAGTIPYVLVMVLVFTILSCVLIKLTDTVAGIYLPCIIGCITLLVFLIQAVARGGVDKSRLAALVIMVAIVMVIHIIKQETVLVWLSDAYCFSMPVALVNSLIFVPLASKAKILGKILYITKYNIGNYAAPFNGVIHVPGIVWGIFLALIFTLPFVYLCFGRRRYRNGQGY